MTYWNQVKLERANIHQTCWIESEYAHRNWLVSLEGNEDEIWKVSEVYPEKKSGETLTEQKKAQRVFEKKLSKKQDRDS